MIQKIIKVDNSAVVIIPKKYFEELNWSIGDKIYTQFDAKSRKIIVSKHKSK